MRVLGVSVPCKLAAFEAQAIPLQLAPTDIAKVVTAREARAAQGLPPFGDERDDMTITELEAAGKPSPAAPEFGDQPPDSGANDLPFPDADEPAEGQ